MRKKSLFFALSAFACVFLLSSCWHTRVTLKTFVDPSIQTSSIKSIAVFSLRNTSLNPGEALQLDRSLTQAFLKKNVSVKIIGSAESTAMLNEKNLVDPYSKFLSGFESSGIPNVNILKQIGSELGVDAILQGTLYDVIQKDGAGGFGGQRPQTSLTLRYTLLNTNNGNTLWEGSSNADKSKASNSRNPAPPLYEVITAAQQKILTDLPVLGK
jgi:hypothetical protein